MAKNSKIDQSKFCLISGVSENKYKSLGTALINLNFGSNVIINCKLHIVDENFPLPIDAILGRDFLTNFNCVVDFKDWKFKFIRNGSYISLPLFDYIDDDEFIIPPRCEVVRRINIQPKEDSIILSTHIQDGVMSGNCIIRDTAYVRFVNTTEQNVIIKDFHPKVEPLSNYNIIELNNKTQNLEDKSRISKLLKELNFSNVPEYAKDSLFKICAEYNDIFHLSSDKLTCNNFYRQEIKTNNENPVYIKNYRIPQTQIPEVNSQVQDLLDNGLIEPSVSPYNSPLLLVPKKAENGQKKWRLVLDYRSVNKNIIADKFPLPRIDEILDGLGRAKFFTTLDLSSSFHQIEIESSSRPITAFTANGNHYQFCRLPFGLKISANSFQRMISIAMSGLCPESSFLYIDDIIVFGCSIKHHNENLCKVFERLRKYNLKLNPQKCNFLNFEVTYLGHKISHLGISPDPKKYDVIKSYPRPTNKDEVRRFVAFCNYYRRFIKNFAEICVPLNNLLKKNVKFIWSSECENSFLKLKEKLMNSTILHYPDPSKSFTLTTDSSNFAFGAILSQGDKVIAFASKSLNKHEINKPIIEKELLAIHWAINYFKPYLYGRKFLVITDHRPLVGLFSHRNPSTKLTNIRLDLLEYNFEVIYKPGSENPADALSRIVVDTDYLKSLIPENSVRVITRSMARNQNLPSISTSDMNSCVTEVQPDHLYIWECTSLSEIKNLTRIQFHICHNSQENKVDVEISNLARTKKNIKIVHVYCTINIMRMRLRDILKIIYKEMNNEGINNNKIALSKKDEMFDYFRVAEFKEHVQTIQKDNNDASKIKIILYNPPLKVQEKDKMLEIIKEYHDSPLGGHFGVLKTFKKIKEHYEWRNMKQMIKAHVKACLKCTLNKTTRHTKEKWIHTETPSSSFEVVEVDLIGPLETTQNYNKYALTIQCTLTKFLEIIPLKSKEANDVARALVENFILKFGNFKILKSDLGKEFVNDIFKNICEILSLKHVTSTAYHHQSLGIIERSHRVLKSYLLNFCERGEWDKWIPYFVSAYNITPHTDTNYTPYELIFGKLFNSINYSANRMPIYNLDSYANELKVRLHEAHQKAKEMLDDVKQKRILKQNREPVDFRINDKVVIKNESLIRFSNPYLGPYVILERLGCNSRIKNIITGKISLVHNDRLKLYMRE